MKQPDRMTKQSRLRRIAKRALPTRLRKHRAAVLAAALDAKAPREPRWVQRLRRINAKRAAKERDGTLRAQLANLLGAAAA